ncbi:hypothetical protein SLS60_009174 [Paraconiothyrium brasiliense]|uniref:Uncharacterized protein n=1 Tax=Paraconiothyrium brasiliense TaxID=300254 RepID=A0ABR3QWL0_9PLEO
MANTVPEYYFAPTWDYPPEGPIKLGNIISSSKKPHRPLANLVPVDTDVMTTNKESVTYSKEKMRSRDFSILASFLSFLGAGADAGIRRGKSNLQNFSFDSVETVQVNPTDAYLQKCVEDDRVRLFLDNAAIFRKPIYIITGVKIAKGVRAKSQASTSAGVMLGVQVDGTVLSGGAIPIGGGPSMETESSQGTTVSWETSQEFVLAYRLSKVRVDRTGAVKTEEEYRKGALLEHNPEIVDLPTYTIAGTELSSPEVGEGYETVVVIEGDSNVTYAIPLLDQEASD